MINNSRFFKTVSYYLIHDRLWEKSKVGTAKKCPNLTSLICRWRKAFMTVFRQSNSVWFVFMNFIKALLRRALIGGHENKPHAIWLFKSSNDYALSHEYFFEVCVQLEWQLRTRRVRGCHSNWTQTSTKYEEDNAIVVNIKTKNMVSFED